MNGTDNWFNEGDSTRVKGIEGSVNVGSNITRDFNDWWRIRTWRKHES